METRRKLIDTVHCLMSDFYKLRGLLHPLTINTVENQVRDQVRNEMSNKVRDEVLWNVWESGICKDMRDRTR